MASTKPAKGMRDFLPEDVRRRNYVVNIIEEVYDAHGFEPLETASVERIETLLGKYGDEGNQLIFRIMKRGASLYRALAKGLASEGKGPTEDALADLGLRYDLTVPLARVVAEYQHALPRYFKRYQIQPVWRADRPARGRFREFYQCDVDIVGTSSPIAEAEVMSAASMVLTRLGFADARIRLNSRSVLFGLMEVAGVPEELEISAIVAIDKLDKVGWEGVATELEQRGVEAKAIAALEPLLELAAEDNLSTLDALAHVLEASERGRKGVEELRALLPLLATSGAGERVDVDPYLARGLSYYTGPIFEVSSPALSGSLGGGGRYDELVGMFLGRDIPAVGFSLGLERLLVVMEEQNMFPEGIEAPDLDVMVALLSGDTVSHALALANTLRRAGLRVDTYPEEAKLGKQFKYAAGRSIPFMAILGPDEVAKGVVSIKNLDSGEQVTIPLEGAAAYLQEARA